MEIHRGNAEKRMRTLGKQKKNDDSLAHLPESVQRNQDPTPKSLARRISRSRGTWPPDCEVESKKWPSRFKANTLSNFPFRRTDTIRIPRGLMLRSAVLAALCVALLLGSTVRSGRISLLSGVEDDPRLQEEIRASGSAHRCAPPPTALSLPSPSPSPSDPLLWLTRKRD